MKLASTFARNGSMGVVRGSRPWPASQANSYGVMHDIARPPDLRSATIASLVALDKFDGAPASQFTTQVSATITSGASSLPLES
jgi:hypothetical protein